MSGCQRLGERACGALPLGLEFLSGATGKFCHGVLVVAAQHCNYLTPMNHTLSNGHNGTFRYVRFTAVSKMKTQKQNQQREEADTPTWQPSSRVRKVKQGGGNANPLSQVGPLALVSQDGVDRHCLTGVPAPEPDL